MPVYEIQGKGTKTGRNRRRTYEARNEIEARRMAEADGTSVEEIIERPPEGPTENQLSYARDLGVTIPDGVTKEELSDLIAVKVERDKPATERHKQFASIYGVEFTSYVGKKSLFNKIQHQLSESGREGELCAWFTFRVYRGFVKGAKRAPIMAPDDPIITELAQALANDAKVVNSIRRYSGRELIWFGEWTSPDGGLYQGGSKRTLAYKAAAAALKSRVRIPRGRESRSTLKRVQSNGAKGCLSVVAMPLMLPALWGLTIWIREWLS